MNKMKVNVYVLHPGMKVVLRDRVMATWLLQYSVVVLGEGSMSSPRGAWSHVASLVVCVMATYSALVVDSATTSCFFKLNESVGAFARHGVGI